ncbi:ATP-binding cassette domain-containing protein [uncultured Clostridium sp.]|uniref:ATP-binding cassette domain-containing protein n=1 Tax=uncultured Clostridium sp. TaxID=59620 RepID=UPI00258FFC51|nr:ATP-binding cassette domain-containing protein [uncultured Clostridium sp.]
MIFKNINLTYKKEVFRDFEINIKENEFNFITGESGIGKTSLLNIIKNRLLESNKKVSYVFQEDRLIPWITVEKNLELILNDRKEIEKLLIEMNLKDVLEKYPYELSGGMKKRINIARAILYDGDIFLMDEPFNGLDRDNKKNIIEIIKKKTKGKTCIIITHNKEEIKAIKGVFIEIYGNPVKIKYNS